MFLQYRNGGHRTPLRILGSIRDRGGHIKRKETMKITRKMTAALLVAQDTQTAYWDALLALEEAIGVEVDGVQDLQNVTVKDLIERA